MPGKNEQDFALVVGINHYRALNPLDGAMDDARAFHHWLLAEAGGNLPEENITAFLSTPDAKHPRLDELVDWFIELIETHSPDLDEKIGRRLYLFLAGHGIGPGIDEAGLLTPNTSALAVKYLAARRFADYYREAALFDEVLLFMDCCRDHEWDLPQPYFPLRRQVDVGAAQAVKNMYVYATGFGRKARERDFDGMIGGIFTRALMEALSGKAADGKGRITGEGLKSYLARRVEDLRADGTDQSPHILLPKDFVLCEGLEPPRVTVTVELSDPAKEFVILLGDGLVPVHGEVRQISEKRREVDLPPNATYLFQLMDNGAPVKLAGRLITEEDRYVTL